EGGWLTPRDGDPRLVVQQGSLQTVITPAPATATCRPCRFIPRWDLADFQLDPSLFGVRIEWTSPQEIPQVEAQLPIEQKLITARPDAITRTYQELPSAAACHWNHVEAADYAPSVHQPQ